MDLEQLLFETNRKREYFNMIKMYEIYSCDGKAEYSAAIIATWSFKNHSNMLICFAPGTFLIIISVKNSYLHIFQGFD